MGAIVAPIVAVEPQAPRVAARLSVERGGTVQLRLFFDVVRASAAESDMRGPRLPVSSPLP